MPRYVNADWLLERAVPMGWSTREWVSDIVIEDALTADGVEVVRCKDCMIHDICRYRYGLGDNGFCSQGKRKETEDEGAY